MQHCYLTAETTDAGLAYHAEQLRLSGVLMAEEANTCFIINAHKAGMRCGKRSASLCKRQSFTVSLSQDTTNLLLATISFFFLYSICKMHMNSQQNSTVVMYL